MVADAFPRRHALLVLLDARVLGFDLMKECYTNDVEMSSIFSDCSKGACGDYSVQEGFLFKGNRLCVPKGLFRELLIREAHGGGLPGHFGIHKTLELLKEHFY